MLSDSLSSLQELSVAQLEALGPDNAAMVTTEQKAVLRKDQRAALDSAETGSPTRAQTSVQSGMTYNYYYLSV